MGRQFFLYGLNYKKIKNDLAPKLNEEENRIALSIYIADSNSKELNINTILTKVEKTPHLLTLEEIWIIIDAYTDSNLLTEMKFDYYQRIEQLGKLGIARLFETSTTDPSNVFMEQFFEDFSDTENEAFEYNDGLYRLTKDNLVKGLNRLIAITEFFYQKEHDPSFQLDAELYNLHASELEKLFTNHTKLRNELGNEYNQLRLNYFSFSWYHENFFYLKKEIDLFDEFLLFDSN